MQTFTFEFGGRRAAYVAWSHAHAAGLASQKLGTPARGRWVLFPGNTCVWRHA